LTGFKYLIIKLIRSTTAETGIFRLPDTQAFLTYGLRKLSINIQQSLFYQAGTAAFSGFQASWKMALDE